MRWRTNYCVKCGVTENLTKDHVIPSWFIATAYKLGFRIKGSSVRVRMSGKPLKYQTLCMKCNHEKGGIVDYSNPVVRAWLKVYIENIQDIINIYEN